MTSRTPQSRAHCEPDNQTIATETGLPRRDAIKIAASSLALAGTGTAVLSAVLAPSPPTTPFLEAMPLSPVLPERALTDPAFNQKPTIYPNRTKNPATGLLYEGRGDDHQHRSLNPPQVFFVQRFGVVPPVSIHPELPKQVNFWGGNLGGENLTDPSNKATYDPPMTPLATIVSRYKAGANTAILVRRFNNLPTGVPSGGFGKNQLSTHLHNFHSGPDSDGGPCDPALFSPANDALAEDPYKQGRFFFPGQYYDYYYNMKRAGFTQPGTPDGDVRETLGTLWYHDHREAHTFENTYKGLAGFHLIFNEYDTGDETTGFRLPSFPDYDIPISLADVAIDPNTGQATFDPNNDGGHLGDKYLVNGKIQPYFNVFRRRYRLRVLDKGPSRHYELFLTNPDNPSQRIPYWRISNDGNLYPKPLQIVSMKLAPGERGDLIVDFNALTGPGGFAPGAKRLWLENRLVQVDVRKPESKLEPAGTVRNIVMEFRIGGLPPKADASRDPALIKDFAPIVLPPLEQPALTRTFEWGRTNGLWVCNGKLLDCNEVRFAMKRGRLERWILRTGGGWAHPIHMHCSEGRIIRRNGVLIDAQSQEYSRKDVVALYAGDEVEYWVRLSDFVGVYPLHCHNTLHEDFGMMMLFRVNDVGDTNPAP